MAVVHALQPSADPATLGQARETPVPVPGDVITGMPATYDMKGTAAVPRLGPPRPGEFGDGSHTAMGEVPPDSTVAAGNLNPAGPVAPVGQDPEERDRARVEVERLKRAASARSAVLAFGGFAAASSASVGTFAGATTLAGLPAAGGGDRGGGVNGEAATDAAIRERLSALQRLTDTAGVSSAADDAQHDKSAFATRARSTDPYLPQRLVDASVTPEIGAGAIIPGVFLTGVSSDLPGQVTGQVSQNVFDSLSGQHLLIPQGAMLIGEYDAKVAFGQERVLLVWTRLRMPNGTSLSLNNMPGVDLSGYAGVTDQVNNHWMKLIGGVVFGSILGAGAQVAQGGTSLVAPSFGQLAMQGAGQNINHAGQEITRRNLGIQPTLEIRPGMRFNVFVTKDVVLPDYRP